MAVLTMNEPVSKPWPGSNADDPARTRYTIGDMGCTARGCYYIIECSPQHSWWDVFHYLSPEDLDPGEARRRFLFVDYFLHIDRGDGEVGYTNGSFRDAVEAWLVEVHAHLDARGSEVRHHFPTGGSGSDSSVVC